MIEGGKEKQILDKMVSKFVELGLLKSRVKARTDSTHILAAVKELTRLEHLEETLKYALNTLAEFAPTWLEKVLTPEIYEHYGRKVEPSKKNRTAAEKEDKAIAIGKDGFYILDAIYAENTPTSIRNLGAVEVLRQVWLQQYYAPRDGKIQLRTEKDGPPHSKRIFSPYEIEARKSTKEPGKNNLNVFLKKGLRSKHGIGQA